VLLSTESNFDRGVIGKAHQLRGCQGAQPAGPAEPGNLLRRPDTTGCRQGLVRQRQAEPDQVVRQAAFDSGGGFARLGRTGLAGRRPQGSPCRPATNDQASSSQTDRVVRDSPARAP